MQQAVYVDLYFLINTAMNLLCLMITSALLHRRVKRWRAVLGAAVGGAYAVAALLLGEGGVLSFLADCGLCGVMCAITFASRKGSAWSILKATAVQFLTSMLMGGIMTGLYTLLNRLELPLAGGEGDGISVWMFALLSLLSGLATLGGGRFFGFSKKTRSVTVEAEVFGKHLCVCALVDSGNLLQDPLSGRSVIVVERTKLLPLLPPPLAEAEREGTPDAWLRDARYVRYIRLIPTKTATGEGCLAAILPHSLSVTDGKYTYAADYLIAPAPLGESAAGFDAIISDR